jgi:hypothetical protein
LFKAMKQSTFKGRDGVDKTALEINASDIGIVPKVQRAADSRSQSAPLAEQKLQDGKRRVDLCPGGCHSIEYYNEQPQTITTSQTTRMGGESGSQCLLS